MQVLEGLDPVRKRPGHVHREHRSERPPPLRVGGRRQLRRRGHGRPRQPDRHHPAGRRRLPGRRRRPRHPHRRQQAAEDDRRRDRPHQAARRRQVRRRGLQGVRRPPRRRRVGRQRAVQPSSSSRSTATASTTGWSSPTAASRQAKLKVVGDAPRGRTGTTVTFWPDGTVFETTEFSARTILERLQMMAFLNKGLEIRFKDERPEHKAEPVTYQVRRRHHRLRQAREHVEGGAVHQGRLLRAGRGRAGGRGRLPVEHRLQRRRHPLLRQRHQHHRGRHPRGGLQGRPHHGGQQARPGQEPPQGEGRRTSRARTSARASPPSSRCACATRSSRARPRASSATRASRRSCRRPPTTGSASGSSRTPPRPTRS